MKISIKNIIFYIFAFFISSYILLEVFAPTKTVDVIGFKSYIIVSESMEPDIMVNDLIFIRKVKEEDLDVRDVIAFSVYIPELGEKGTVTHYINDIELINGETVYKTQGAISSIDDWTDESGNPVEITYEDIEGRVVLVIPNIGHIINILKDPISIGLIGINGVIIYLLVKVFKSTDKEEVIKETE